MAEVGIKDLLEGGVHFGHQTQRWNPKMQRFIVGERDGIHIIDLLETEARLKRAQEVAEEVGRRGGTILFVGTKKQARDAIKEAAESAGMPYVNHRWLGGLQTNYQTIRQRIKRLHDLENLQEEGQLALLPTRERMAAEADLAKLQANLGGVKNMERAPSAIFVIDLTNEAIAVHEARRLRIPIIGLVDTNCDPDDIDYVIPGNDDGMRSCALIANTIAQASQEGKTVFQREEEIRLKAEAEARAKREAEEQARKEAEEKARLESEEALKKKAEEVAKQEAEKAKQEAAAAQEAEKQADKTPEAETTAAGQAEKQTDKAGETEAKPETSAEAEQEKPKKPKAKKKAEKAPKEAKSEPKEEAKPEAEEESPEPAADKSEKEPAK